MKLLIAEDNGLFQKALHQILACDYQIIMAHDGNEAWAALQHPDPPRLAILDWVMPGLSGPEVCRKVRAYAPLSSMYLIILTAKNSAADIASGLRAGADDYITKPPVPAELRARVKVGEQVLALQDAVEAQSAAANQASQQEKRLREMFDGSPLCRRLPTWEYLSGVEASLRQRLEPADDCSISGTKALPMNRLLTTSLEYSHS